MDKTQRLKQQNNVIFFAKLRMAALQRQFEQEEQRKQQKKRFKKYLRRLKRNLRKQQKRHMHLKKMHRPSCHVQQPKSSSLVLEFGLFAPKATEKPLEYRINYRP